MVNTIGVASINVALQQANRGTGTMLSAIAIPGLGNLAYGQDAEGNTFRAMMQADPPRRRGAQTTVMRRVFSTANPPRITVNYLKMHADVFEEMHT